ncbi:MAG: hypothetical protein LBN40_01760 [Oscillospiraceae bacterium]|jgi:hypothetical protein|nr:hypothetical protein [Oscillospiraceae bacterium]
MNDPNNPNSDKIALLKEKQGLTEVIEDETPHLKRVYPKPTGKKAWENFWYHYKIHVWVFGFIILTVVFFMYDSFSTPKDDVAVLSVTSDKSSSAVMWGKTEMMGEALSLLVEDYNGDGKNHVGYYYIDARTDGGVDAEVASAAQTRLVGELQSNVNLLMFADLDTVEKICADIPYGEVFADLRSVIRSKEIVDKVFFPLNKTYLAEITELKDAPDDIYVMLRKPGDQEAYDRSVILLRYIVDNNGG